MARDGRIIAAVERKTLVDLIGSLIGGKLRYALGELAALPRAAVVVEDRYSRIFDPRQPRPGGRSAAQVADGLAEVSVRWPAVPIVFGETRKLAQEWTYRFLAAACVWGEDESAAVTRIGLLSLPGAAGGDATAATPPAPEPTTAEVRAWARATGLDVPDRGKLRPHIHQAWRDAHGS